MDIAFFSLAAQLADAHSERISSMHALMAALDSYGARLHPIPDTETSTVTFDDGNAARKTPDLWMTHGLSASAPDPLGPRVSAQLRIPYAAVDPHIPAAAAPLGTAGDAELLRSALSWADAVFVTDPVAAGELEVLLPEPERLTRIRPFLDTSPFTVSTQMRDRHRAEIASRLQLPPTTPWLLAPALMANEGVLESYTLLGRALSRIPQLDWFLIAAAGSEISPEVDVALGVLPRHRVRLLSEIGPDDSRRLLISSDLLVWPALKDTGLARILEAQASGLPAVACDSPAVAERIRDGLNGRLAGAGNSESFANAVSFLLRHRSFLVSMSERAAQTARSEHDLSTAGSLLGTVLERVLERAAARA